VSFGALSIVLPYFCETLRISRVYFSFIFCFVWGTVKQYLLSMGLVCLIAVGEMAAQTEPYINGRLDVDNRGISFMNKDSTMLVIMRFRMQALAQTETVSDEDLSTSRENWVLRRLRLRFGGFLTDPRLTYNIQLSFTRGDMDFADTGFPNIVRDAVVYWNFDNNWQIGFGQTKLPGNRQRVVSSSEMQYAERSVVNNTFNIDRDFGFQGWYRNTIEGVGLNLRAAISNGDGRNTISTSGASAGGFCYTGRAEILPFGAFTGGGDYFEGDVLREKTPKLSVGATYSVNSRMRRTMGQLGPELYTPTANSNNQLISTNTLLADALLKYSGLALYGEYAMRDSKNNPVTKSANVDDRFVFLGTGILAQASYCFPSMWEIVGRFAAVTPFERMNDTTLFSKRNLDAGRVALKETNISVGVNKYFNRHRVRINTELMYRIQENMIQDKETKNFIARLNMELGI
jgi:phosphate-selective porin OprO/OprP